MKLIRWIPAVVIAVPAVCQTGLRAVQKPGFWNAEKSIYTIMLDDQPIIQLQDVNISLKKESYRTAEVTISFTPHNVTNREFRNILFSYWFSAVQDIANKAYDPRVPFLYEGDTNRKNAAKIENLLADGVGSPVIVRLSGISCAPGNYPDYKQIVYTRIALGDLEVVPNQTDLALMAKQAADRESAKQAELIAAEAKKQKALHSQQVRDMKAAQAAKEAERAQIMNEQRRINYINLQPEKFRELLIAHQVCIGMNSVQVRLAYGPPHETKRVRTPGVTREIWVYLRYNGYPRKETLSFVNDLLIEIVD